MRQLTFWKVFGGLLLASGCQPALSQDICSQLGAMRGSLADGQLYYKSTKGWLPLAENQPLGVKGIRWVTLIYVVKETWSPERAGVLAIKTGRKLEDGEKDSPDKKVELVRKRETEIDNGACGRPAIDDFGNRPVTAKSYDGYHDYGYVVDDVKTLDEFHVKYLARSGRCRATGSVEPDSIRLFGGDYRSNRSQFSFDARVVNRGMFSQVVAAITFARAYASSAGLGSQRVEVRQYATGADGLACVRFQAPVAGSGSFLRINDLEAAATSSGPWVRARERSWRLAN